MFTIFFVCPGWSTTKLRKFFVVSFFLYLNKSAIVKPILHCKQSSSIVKLLKPFVHCLHGVTSKKYLHNNNCEMIVKQ